MHELIRFLKKAKNKKSPGPDGFPMEFYKWLNEEMKLEVLDILNLIWRNNWFLETMEDVEELQTNFSPTINIQKLRRDA